MKVQINTHQITQDKILWGSLVGILLIAGGVKYQIKRNIELSLCAAQNNSSCLPAEDQLKVTQQQLATIERRPSSAEKTTRSPSQTSQQNGIQGGSKVPASNENNRETLSNTFFSLLRSGIHD